MQPFVSDHEPMSYQQLHQWEQRRNQLIAGVQQTLPGYMKSIAYGTFLMFFGVCCNLQQEQSTYKPAKINRIDYHAVTHGRAVSD